MLRIIEITGPDILQGIGIRCSIWVSGCKHHCPFCQNKWTWQYYQGVTYKEHKQEIFDKLKKYLSTPYYKGITFSGGDPLYQDEEGLEELMEIIKFVKNEFPSKDIWLYTGFTLEEIKKTNNETMKNIVNNVDFLVDGKYVNNLRDISLKFRGSSNQIIWQKDNKSGNFIKSELNI